MSYRICYRAADVDVIMTKKKVRTDECQELGRTIGQRYRAGSRQEKCWILDDFVAVTGDHLKHYLRDDG